MCRFVVAADVGASCLWSCRHVLVYDLDAELGEGGEVFPFVYSHVPCFEGVGPGDLHSGLFLLVCDACELVCDFLQGFVHGVIAFLRGASRGSRTHGSERTK